MMDMHNVEFASVDEFWAFADELQDECLLHAQDLFVLVEKAEPELLIALLTQYRFFTLYYVADLAILIARIKDGKLRSFLADILSDELGYGDPLQAHTRLYDDFLSSLGANMSHLDCVGIEANIALLDKARRQLIDPNESSNYGIGFRGMGGECTCQVYLAKLYEYVVKNPYIKQMRNELDWRFWELHIGEHDIEHRIQTRQLIHAQIVSQDPSALVALARGYYDSMTSWRTFWDNIFDLSKLMVHKQCGILASDKLTLAPAPDRDRDRDMNWDPLGADPVISQFHLALPVHDLRLAQQFYCQVLGAKEGRSTANHIDVNFYGHHLVLHIAAADADHIFDSFESDFHGESVPVPHFGINLNRQAWSLLAERIRASQHQFHTQPHIRLAGQVGEHASMFILDPSGNALEFKAFLNHQEVFAKIFDPQTTDLFGLGSLTESARQ